eukprot:6056517-Pyramimonas_sp.AAC.1
MEKGTMTPNTATVLGQGQTREEGRTQARRSEMTDSRTTRHTTGVVSMVVPPARTLGVMTAQSPPLQVSGHFGRQGQGRTAQ